MRVLLDENLDHGLRKFLAPHEVVTVSYKGWSGLKNGELLRAAEDDGIDVLLTGDGTLSHEQNLSGQSPGSRGTLGDPASNYQKTCRENTDCDLRGLARFVSRGGLWHFSRKKAVMNISEIAKCFERKFECLFPVLVHPPCGSR